MDERQSRYPKFRFGEVVRVRHMSEWLADTPDMTGQEATVSAFSPTRQGTAWSVSVWLPVVEEVWSFDESDLESLGMVELDGKDDPPVRVPLDPATHVASFGGDLAIRLVTEVEEAQAARVAAEAESAVRSVIDVAATSWKGEVHWHPPYRYDLDLDVRTEGDSRAAFEALVASRESGWTSRVDDGWSAMFWWSLEADDSGAPFLVAEASDVALTLTPWSSPEIRRVKLGRTNDPGLPGFTPPRHLKWVTNSSSRSKRARASRPHTMVPTRNLSASRSVAKVEEISRTAPSVFSGQVRHT